MAPKQTVFIKYFKIMLKGRLGDSVGWVSAFGLGHNPRVLGLSPASGSLLSRKPASPSPTPPACVPALTAILSLINKIFKKKKKEEGRVNPETEVVMAEQEFVF